MIHSQASTSSQAPESVAQAPIAVDSAAPTAAAKPLPAAPARKPEIGGPKGPEPTRYGDWEKAGRCIDF